VGNTFQGPVLIACVPVHPHTRGEHRRFAVRKEQYFGSSPHAWGTHVLMPPGPAAGRFIPTRVGNTLAGDSAGDTDSVHPHTRGEHFMCHENSLTKTGSSPHAWGTQTRPSPAARRNSVHPHTRGEHPTFISNNNLTIGSSPHAWGTRMAWTGRRWRLRFIPTRVGNTKLTDASATAKTVHPHTRGEHVGEVGVRRQVRGSSPHAWGTRPWPATPPLCPRFIPTRVGNTPLVCPVPGGYSVHPHTRGEHSLRIQRDRAGCGSSPHAWGTPPVTA